MSALFRAAAAVLVSCALGAGVVYGARLLDANGAALSTEGRPADAIPAPPGRDAAALLAGFAEGRGARTARFDAVAQACGEAFALRRGGVAGVDHVIAFLAQASGDEAGPGEPVEIRRLSAPEDLIGVQAGRGALRLTSPDGFEGLAWTLAGDANPEPIGPVEADALTLPCADPATAAARFHARAGGAPAAAR